jgi:hypothetical protein
MPGWREFCRDDWDKPSSVLVEACIEFYAQPASHWDNEHTAAGKYQSVRVEVLERSGADPRPPATAVHNSGYTAAARNCP